MLDAAPAAPQQAEPCDVCNALTVPRNATHYDADDLKAAQVRGKIIAAKLQQQAEPVGYFVNDESDDQWHQVDYEQRNGADTYPLYLHPPAAEVQRLRAAALALLNELDAGRHGAHEFNNLRNALRGE